MNRVEPNRNVYVGHRYVPLLVGEWDNSIQYEGLSIVTYQGASYTSKKMTPAGIDIENEEYWVLTGNYNAQVEYYRQETERVSDDLAQAKIDLNQRMDDTVQYVDTNVEDLTIYVNDEVRKNRDYVDGEVLELTGYVNDEVSTLNETMDNKVDKGEIILNIKDMGAKGDGVTNDTLSIQNAIDSSQTNGSTLFFPSGTYLVTHLTLTNKISILGESGSVLKVLDNTDYAPDGDNEYSLVLDIKNADDVIIKDLTIDGNRYNLNYELPTYDYDGEAYAILIKDSSNVRLENLVLKNCGTDGLLTWKVNNLFIKNCLFDNNRRQGWSMIGADKNVTVESCTFSDTNGTSPEGGVDIEPMGEDMPENITFSNCNFLNNPRGLIITNGSKDVKVLGCTFKDHSFIWGGVYVGDVSNVIIESCIFSSEGKNTASIYTSENAKNVKVNNNIFKDTGNGGETADIETWGTNIDISNNIFSNTLMSADLNGKTVSFVDNLITNPSHFFATKIISDHIKFVGNRIFAGPESNSHSVNFSGSQDKGIFSNNYLENSIFGNDSTVFGIRDGNISPLDNNKTTGWARPTTGTWDVGDRIYNTSPSSGGYLGWVCVSAGEPGTWKGFGLIEAE